MIIELLPRVFESSAPLILEQLEERIVLDGAVEATAGTWDAPTPGEGIFDGDFHRIEDQTFVFLEGLGAGLGIGYWWNPELQVWGWALDYESGWWWEDRGSGWDWMNVGLWDFEWYANAGVCAFDGRMRIDWAGAEFTYVQAEDEMLYRLEGIPFMKYELGSENDSGWGWQWWDTSSGRGTWVAWEDGSGDPYALPTNSYSGFSAEFLYDGAWRWMPGGHGKDWVAFNPADSRLGGVYWLWCDNGTDLKIDYTVDASATPVAWNTAWDGASSSDWAYMGDSMFVFESDGPNGIDRQWTIYDGSAGVDDVWFTYRCANYDASAASGAWDFDGCLELAFLSDRVGEEGVAYSSNEDYLITNAISVVGDAYDNATIADIAAMMDAISQSQGNIFFSAVMFHGDGANIDDASFRIGSTTVSKASLGALQPSFEEMAGLLLGYGEPGRILMMNSNAAEPALQPVMAAIQGFLDGNGPWGDGNSPTLWASVDTTGDWFSCVDDGANWALEWSAENYDPADPYGNALGRDELLYVSSAVSEGVRALSGDSEVNRAPTVTGDGVFAAITEDEIDNGGQTVAAVVGDTIEDADPDALEGIAVFGLSDDAGTWEYSTDGGAVWHAVAAVDTSNALLLRSTDLIRYTPNGENGGSGSIDYYAWDQTAGAAGTKVDASERGGITSFSESAASASILVSDVNDAPTVTLADMPPIPCDICEIDLSQAIRVDDVDSSTLSVSLHSAGWFECLSVSELPNVTIEGNGTCELTLQGSAADVNAVLATLEGMRIGAAAGDGPIYITVTDETGGETHAALTVTSPVDPAAPSCTVTPLDPVSPGCGEVDLGSVFSIDEGFSSPIAVLIHCSEGFTSVTLDPPPGVMVTTSEDGSATGLYSMDPVALQTALNTLSGTLAPDFNGDASIVFIVSDGVTVTCYAFDLEVCS